MRRFHLFELEDQPWFPRIVRDLATDYLRFIELRFQLHRPIVPLLAEALRATGSRQVVDLCSGGGGLVMELQKALGAEGLDTAMTLTDLFPNLRAFALTEEASRGRITFVSESVDARCVPDHLLGFRTIFNSFHHFAPVDAKRILHNAVEARQPIAIFEYPERTPLIVLLTLVLTPLLVAFLTPFIRPFRWSRLLYTYLPPLVPLTCWWDGVVSTLRAYTVNELNDLTNDRAMDLFQWRAKKMPLPNSPAHLTYLIGHDRSGRGLAST